MRFTEIDYLAIGHATLDQAPTGMVPGGTVTFASRVAQVLGCRVGVLTSASTDLDLTAVLPKIAVSNLPAEHTTVFENVYLEGRRRQKIYSVAEGIRRNQIPDVWKRAPIVHFGPVANEVDSSMASLFTNSLVGLTPQGWFRRWDEHGIVSQTEWAEALTVLPLAAVVILSEEDLADPAALELYLKNARILVLTEQAGGCRVHSRGEVRHFPAPTVEEVNPTGAGDIFAAAYLVRFHQTRGNPWAAAEFANRVAAISVTRQTLDEKISAISAVLERIED